MHTGAILIAFVVTLCSITTHAAELNIKLSEIVSFSTQPGLIQASDRSKPDGSFEEPYGYHLQQIVEATESGASNVFVVDGNKIEDAIKATSEVLLGAGSASAVASQNRKQSSTHWLIAYLGAGHGGPPKYIIKAVSLNGNRIRVAYDESHPQTVTTDIRPYYYWIPVGRLRDDVYKLELYDTSLKEVTLMRRVEVKSSH